MTHREQKQLKNDFVAAGIIVTAFVVLACIVACVSSAGEKSKAYLSGWYAVSDK